VNVDNFKIKKNIAGWLLNKLALIFLANTTSNVFRCFYFGVGYVRSLHYYIIFLWKEREREREREMHKIFSFFIKLTNLSSSR